LGGLRSAFLSVEDIHEATAWYTDLLGAVPYFEEDFYVGFDVAGYELGLVPGSAAMTEAAWATHDPAGALEHAVALGASIVEEPRDVGDGIVVATFEDPFGNRIGLIRNPGFAPQMTAAAAQDVSPRMITVSGTVPVESAEAWALWATEEGLARWWTPNSKVELRPGGQYEIHFYPDAEPGDRGGDWCRVLSFLPGRMLSFTWNAPPTLKTRPDHTWVVVTFDSLDEGTSVTLNHLGWPESGLADPASDWSETLSYFEEAWQHVMGLFVDQFGEVS
ncbi:MAG: SRPBCC domain-containing protein, partial [Acidimicrobiia bacterium]